MGNYHIEGIRERPRTTDHGPQTLKTEGKYLIKMKRRIYQACTILDNRLRSVVRGLSHKKTHTPVSFTKFVPYVNPTR